MTEAAAGPRAAVAVVFPGSWINGDFYIWAGHRDDHRAWAQLAAARRAFDAAQRRRRVAEARGAGARGAADRRRQRLVLVVRRRPFVGPRREFDELFRRHLRNVYEALGQPVPDELHVTNITTKPQVGPVRLGVLTSPVIDGRARDFTQWAGSVEVALGGGGGTMQRVTARLVQALRLAAHQQYLYLRLDGPELVRRLLAAEVELALLEDQPKAQRLVFRPAQSGYDAGPRWRAEEVVTAAVSFAVLGGGSGGLDSRVVPGH